MLAERRQRARAVDLGLYLLGSAVRLRPRFGFQADKLPGFAARL
jgi:hypothetical protein